MPGNYTPPGTGTNIETAAEMVKVYFNARTVTRLAGAVIQNAANARKIAMNAAFRPSFKKLRAGIDGSRFDTRKTNDPLRLTVYIELANY